MSPFLPAAVQCSELHPDPPLLMNCSGPWGHFSYGTTCTFGCPEGQALNGSETAACGPDGQWSVATPSCEGTSACGLRSHARGCGK